MQISMAFDVNIDKSLVRHVLIKNYKPDPNGGGPSWLRFIGYMIDRPLVH